MYTEYYKINEVVQNNPLGVGTIYRVMGDQTYRVNHLAEKSGRQVFVYTDFGQGILNCAEGVFVLEAGTGLVFSADEPFSYRTAEKQWHFWWFEFEGECPCEKGVLYTVLEEQWFGRLGELALKGLREGNDSAASYLACLLTFLRDVSLEEQKKEDLFSRAQALIKKQLYGMNVSSLAGELSVDPRTLYNVFRTGAGCSPKEYLRVFVMDQAKFLLVNTTKSIGEIGEELGFANQFHFSRVFRETVGMAPSEYRKKY